VAECSKSEENHNVLAGYSSNSAAATSSVEDYSASRVPVDRQDLEIKYAKYAELRVQATKLPVSSTVVG
jgi:hypothetical protein